MNWPMLYQQNYTHSVAQAYGQQNGTTLPDSTANSEEGGHDVTS